MNTQATPYPQRVRNELRFRELTVLSSSEVYGFQRVVFGGEALEGFSSRGFDDHIKLFFPEPGSTFVAPQVTEEGIVWGSAQRPPSRDYTPLFDEASRQLTIDFYMHQQGVASDWARAARPGDRLCIGGPRGSLVVPANYQWQLYVCDESGLPALRRRLEALRAARVSAEVRAIVSISDPVLQGYLAHLPEFAVEWVIGHQPQQVAERLAALNPPSQDYFIWITGEGKVVKTLSQRYENSGLDAELLRAVAYWHHKTA